jgi:hypothetical protein
MVQHVSDAWLQHRLSLFESFCLPSVASQVNQAFRWLVFVDTLTEDAVIKRLERSRAIRSFELCYCSAFHRKFLRRLIREMTVECDLLITSRLDNDDILHPGYTFRILQNIQASVPHWINFDTGYKLDNTGLYYCELRSNMFISLVEQFRVRDEAITVFATKHTEAASLAHIHHVTEGEHWIQVVHGYNQRNCIDPFDRRVSLPEALERLKGFCPTVVRNAELVLNHEWMPDDSESPKSL